MTDTSTNYDELLAQLDCCWNWNEKSPEYLAVVAIRELTERERIAIASWDEERQRSEREGKRVVELATELSALKSDISRHVQIAAGLATELEAEKKARDLAEESRVSEFAQSADFSNAIWTSGQVDSPLVLPPSTHDWRTMTVSELAAGNPSLKAYSDELEDRCATTDRILRASVPEKHKHAASPVGAVQNYIADLEQDIGSLCRTLHRVKTGTQLGFDRALSHFTLEQLTK